LTSASCGNIRNCPFASGKVINVEVIVGSGPSSIPRPGGILGFYLPSRERWYHDSIASPTAAQSHDIAISILMLSGKFLSVALRILFQAANMISPSLLTQKIERATKGTTT